jgi:hypothetical protein
MGVNTGTAYAEVRVKLDQLQSDVNRVTGIISGMERKVDAESTKAGKAVGGNIAKGVFVGQIAYKALEATARAAFNFVKDSVRISVDAQETYSKFAVVFDEMGESAEVAAGRFADAFGVAEVSAKAMLSNTGNLLQGFGATQEESLNMSVAVNTLASDLASFTNFSGGAEGASQALTKALLGERESAKSLGLVIRDSDVNARIAAAGQDKLTGAALNLAKAQATLEIITEQSSNAIGDYARTQDSAANQMKRAGEATKELQVAIGTTLSPALAVASGLWADFATNLARALNESNKIEQANKTYATVARGAGTLEEQLENLPKVIFTAQRAIMDMRKAMADPVQG